MFQGLLGAKMLQNEEAKNTVRVGALGIYHTKWSKHKNHALSLQPYLQTTWAKHWHACEFFIKLAGIQAA